MNERVLGHPLLDLILLSLGLVLGSSLLWILLIYILMILTRSVTVKSCNCGAHWWIKRWGFWRHLDASPFNDKLQNLWSIWFFEFRTVLKLTVKDQVKMGYPQGPVWEDGKPMWARSKWQLKFKPTSYCVRCMMRERGQ